MIRTLTGLITTAVLLGMGFAIMLALFLFWGTRPVAYVWTARSGGELVEACAPHLLDEPFYSNGALAQFGAEAVTELNNYDYLDWDERLPPLVERYFTAQAADQYLEQFEGSALLARVQRDYYTVQAQVARPPIVTAINPTGDRRSWQVQIPVQVFYLTGARTLEGLQPDDQQTQRLLFRVRVVEQSPNERNYRGVAIADLNAVPVSSFRALERLRDG